MVSYYKKITIKKLFIPLIWWVITGVRSFGGFLLVFFATNADDLTGSKGTASLDRTRLPVNVVIKSLDRKWWTYFGIIRHLQSQGNNCITIYTHVERLRVLPHEDEIIFFFLSVFHLPCDFSLFRALINRFQIVFRWLWVGILWNETLSVLLFEDEL